MMTFSFSHHSRLTSLVVALMGLASPVQSKNRDEDVATKGLPEWFQGKGSSLKNYLNPNLFADPATMDQIREELTDHESLIVIKNAFQHEVAAMVHSEMEQSLKDFVIDKDYKHTGNHHHYHKLEDFETPTLDLISRVFNDVETKRMIGELSNRDCMGEAATSIRWYDRGDYTLPTTDFVYQRTIAFEWLLTKDWLTEWGGATYVNQESHNNGYLHADYNTLLLWHVRPDFTHFVTPVLHESEGHRLSVSGYFSSQWIPTAEDPELEKRLESWPYNFTAIQFQALHTMKNSPNLPRKEELEPLIDDVLGSMERPIMATYVFGEEVHEEHWEEDEWEGEHEEGEHWDDEHGEHHDEHYDNEHGDHQDGEEEHWDEDHHDSGEHDEHWDNEEHTEGEEPQGYWDDEGNWHDAEEPEEL